MQTAETSAPGRKAVSGFACLLWFLLAGCAEQPGQVDAGPRRSDGARDSGVADILSDGADGDARCFVVTISVSTSGELANDTSVSPAISRDAKFVVFTSRASNLWQGVKGGVYLRDLDRQTTILVSVSNAGVPAMEDGTWGNGLNSISDDGRYVGFMSTATNLVPGAGGSPYLFRRDTVAGLTEVSSLSSTGGPVSGYGLLSGDGRRVAFESHATDVVAGDMNGLSDIFLRDLEARTTVRVSVGQDGSECETGTVLVPQPSISGDGSRVVFTSGCLLVTAPPPLNKTAMTYVWDQDGTLTLVCNPNGEPVEARGPALNQDGTVVVYRSARDPTTGVKLPHDNLFLFDTGTRTNERLTLAVNGAEPDGDSIRPAISPNGRYVSFSSRARNLVPQGTSGFFSAFVIDRQAGTTALVSVDREGRALPSSDELLGNRTSVADDGSVAFDADGCHYVNGVCHVRKLIYIYQGCD